LPLEIGIPLSTTPAVSENVEQCCKKGNPLALCKTKVEWGKGVPTAIQTIREPILNNAALPVNTVTVCVLDDDPSVLKALGRLLSSAEWRVATFSDPHLFLRYAQTDAPAVVVLDMSMPIMHGLEVQTRLHQVSPGTRVIVLTAKDDPIVRDKALAAGAFAFFLKPQDDAELLTAIETAVSHG
jgi:two-component system response regulator HydG